MLLQSSPKIWPGEGHCRIPYWVYYDGENYEREQEMIFRGPAWNYVGLEAEIPRPGDFKTTFVGETPIIVARDLDGSINAMVNQCGHRGTKVCREAHGNKTSFTCVYHQWCYDLKGNLKAVPFRDGVWSGNRLASGLPKDFDFGAHGMRPVRACAHNGVVFASFDAAAPEFSDYLGPKMRYYFERVFDGRGLRFLGRSRQRLACNWKLVFENIKDYHATLLHVFLVTFGLYRADQPSRIELDEMGRHSVLVSSRATRAGSGDIQGISSLKPDYVLHDTAIITGRREFKDEPTVVMQTLFPNLIIQQQTNTLALRQILPKGPRQTELVWDFFGYEDDDEEMQKFRLNQSSLMGPAGLVTIDDAEAVEICQRGLEAKGKSAAVVEMGGQEIADTDYMVTEAPLRGFYRYYRNIMGLVEP